MKYVSIVEAIQWNPDENNKTFSIRYDVNDQPYIEDEHGYKWYLTKGDYIVYDREGVYVESEESFNKSFLKLDSPLVNQPTNRNFSRYEFIDRYGEECSLQKSSLASEDAIWLGVNEARPIKGLNGEICYSARMHLTQEQVRNILPILLKFVETGEI